jgi:hypothetical protein
VMAAHPPTTEVVVAEITTVVVVMVVGTIRRRPVPAAATTAPARTVPDVMHRAMPTPHAVAQAAHAAAFRLGIAVPCAFHPSAAAVGAPASASSQEIVTRHASRHFAPVVAMPAVAPMPPAAMPPAMPTLPAVVEAMPAAVHRRDLAACSAMPPPAPAAGAVAVAAHRPTAPARVIPKRIPVSALSRRQVTATAQMPALTAMASATPLRLPALAQERPQAPASAPHPASAVPNPAAARAALTVASATPPIIATAPASAETRPAAVLKLAVRAPALLLQSATEAALEANVRILQNVRVKIRITDANAAQQMPAQGMCSNAEQSMTTRALNQSIMIHLVKR